MKKPPQQKLILNCHPIPYTNSDRVIAYKHRLQRHLRALKNAVAIPLPIKKSKEPRNGLPHTDINRYSTNKNALKNMPFIEQLADLLQGHKTAQLTWDLRASLLSWCITSFARQSTDGCIPMISQSKHAYQTLLYDRT